MSGEDSKTVKLKLEGSLLQRLDTLFQLVEGLSYEAMLLDLLDDVVDIWIDEQRNGGAR